MKIELIDLRTRSLKQKINLSLSLAPVCVIKAAKLELATGVLNAIVGLERILEGQILIDETPLGSLLQAEALPKTFGYVFADGIMLSNLTLRENLLLPYRLVVEGEVEQTFTERAAEWMERFKLDIDLELRPAFAKASDLKLLSLIRALIFNPRILILDDPYYLLNQDQRKLCFEVLQSIRQEHFMLINSRDDDFCLMFGAEILKLSPDLTAIS